MKRREVHSWVFMKDITKNHQYEKNPDTINFHAQEKTLKKE